MKNKNLSRINCNVEMKNMTCVVCLTKFTQNKLAYVQLCCSDECSKINRRNKQTEYQKSTRKLFREKYGLSSSKEPNSLFVYQQDILDSNPILLETLHALQRLRQSKGMNISDEEKYKERIEYFRKYRKDVIGKKPRIMKNKLLDNYLP